jgi:hypothetical protein
MAKTPLLILYPKDSDSATDTAIDMCVKDRVTNGKDTIDMPKGASDNVEGTASDAKYAKAAIELAKTE